MSSKSFDLIVIGAGSGGLAAAKRASSYGAKVAIVEGDKVGGTCVIRGCVPKKLLVYGSHYGDYIKNAKSYGIYLKGYEFESALLLKNIRNEVERLNNLHKGFLEKSGVHLFKGWGEFINEKEVLIKNSHKDLNDISLSAEKILIATGGIPSRPNIPGSSLGWVSDDMFLLEKFPKSITIIGSGFIACEFACILNSLGVEVTQLIRGERLLKNFDNDLSDNLTNQMISKGINLKFNHKVISVIKKDQELKISTNLNNEFLSEGLLFAIGRNPFIDNLGLNKVGINTHQGKISVDKNNMTNIKNIFAIGDVTDRVNLTPVAIEEGRVLSDNLFGMKNRTVNYSFIPKAVFTTPEIAGVGYTEQDAIDKFGESNIVIHKTKFKPMSNALPKGDKICLLKLVVNNDSKKIIGCHMLGESASEIIQMASIAIIMGSTKNDFDKTMALHPTISEEFVTMT